MSGAAVVLWARWAALTRAGQVVSHSLPASAARRGYCGEHGGACPSPALGGASQRRGRSMYSKFLSGCVKQRGAFMEGAVCILLVRAELARCDARRRESGRPPSAWGWRFGHGASPLAFVSPSACAGWLQTYLHIGSVQDSLRPVEQGGAARGVCGNAYSTSLCPCRDLVL